NVRRLGVVLPERFRELARRHPRVGDVRGKGLLASLELVRDRKSHAALVPANTDSSLPRRIRRRAWGGGVQVMACGSLILMAPTLIVQPELRAVPAARLLVYRDTLAGAARESLRQRFHARGLGDDRLDLRPGSAHAYLEVYRDIDVSLDVFP